MYCGMVARDPSTSGVEWVVSTTPRLVTAALHKIHILQNVDICYAGTYVKEVWTF